MTVTAAPYSLAMSFETTTQVRNFFGSTPTEGSHRTHSRSPLRMRPSLIVEEIELAGFQVREEVGGLSALGGVVGRELLQEGGTIRAGERILDQPPGVGRHADPAGAGPALQAPNRVN